jgi:two-component system cell cycle response regulator DivK
MSKMVLLVEDSVDERLLYSTILRHFGYDVVEAANAVDGMRLAREMQPDAILLDVHMPGLNGLVAAKRLKADPRTSHIPIIAMTVHRISPSIVKESGAEAYLPKPFLPKDLSQALSSLLAEPAND